MADGVGFEPTEGFHLRRFSRPVLSTAQPPIRLMYILRYKYFRVVSISMLVKKLLTIMSRCTSWWLNNYRLYKIILFMTLTSISKVINILIIIYLMF